MKVGRRKEKRKKENRDFPRTPATFIVKDDLLAVFTAMSRSGVNKVLALLAKRPGLTLKELSGTLKLRKSATCAYVRKLYAMGLITRDIKSKTAHYIIKSERAVRIIRAIDSLHSDNHTTPTDDDAAINGNQPSFPP